MIRIPAAFAATFVGASLVAGTIQAQTTSGAAHAVGPGGQEIHPADQGAGGRGIHEAGDQEREE